MKTSNINIPYQEGFVRNAFLFQDFKNKELTPCYIFGAKIQLNSPLLFHCQLENGAVFWSLPIHAFVHKEEFEKPCKDEKELLSLLQYWNMQGELGESIVFSYLQGYIVECYNRNKEWVKGEYLFTIDDFGGGYADDTDSKCFHIIKLDNGFYAAYPNNYLRWHNLNFVNAFDKENPPKYKANVTKWNAEYVRI
ncbi:MAG: hypothetical protein RIQ59_545 [Bacteroidota bacterium]|jgi:hypothetical protein